MSITSWNTFTWANIRHFSRFPPARKWSQALSWYWKVLFAHVKVFQLVIDTGWDIIYVMWHSWMLSTHFKLNKTFQYQERAWDHFLAGGKGLQCVIFSLITADKRDWICSYLRHIAHMNVIVSVWTLIYLMW